MSKIQVKIKYVYPFPEDQKLKFIPEGDGVDVRSAIDYMPMAPVVNSDGTITFDFKFIPLGFCMELPKGFKADLKPRSGSYKKQGFIQPNSPGLIDGPNPIGFCGDSDQWHLPCLFTQIGKECPIKAGDRIGQFEIVLSQKATAEQKKLWLESDGFEFVEVESLNNNDRGGFGDGTGTK